MSQVQKLAVRFSVKKGLEDLKEESIGWLKQKLNLDWLKATQKVGTISVLVHVEDM